MAKEPMSEDEAACLPELQEAALAPGSGYSWPLQCFIGGLCSEHLLLPRAI